MRQMPPCFIVRDQTARRSLAFTAMMKPAGRHGAMVALPQQRGCPHGERCFRNQMGGLFATDCWVLHKTKTPALWSDVYSDLKVKI